MQILVGSFCHIPEDANGVYQGRVIRETPEEVLVQLYSFLDGEPSEVRVYPRQWFVQLATLFATRADWIEAGNARLARGWQDER